MTRLGQEMKMVGIRNIILGEQISSLVNPLSGIFVLASSGTLRHVT